MVLSRLTKITGPGIRTDTNWVGNNANYTGILTAATLGDVGNLNITGIITATTFAGTLQTAAQPNITSVGTLSSLNVSGSVSIGGTLTYEDVTNVDSVGVITARSGLVSPNADIDDFVSVGSNIHLGNAGVVTATSFVGSGAALTGIDATSIKDSSGNVKIQAQASGAIHTGISTFDTIKVGSGVTIESNGQATFTGIVTFGSGSTTIDNNVVNVGTALTLGHTQGLQFHTQNLHSQGFEVNQINASGIVTATTFKGNGDFVELNVDGHTNLDNLSIAGVSTFNDDVTFDSALSGREMVWDKSDNALEFGSYAQIKLEDQASVRFGTDEDMILWHNGNHANIKNTTGRLYILADDIWIKDGDDGDIHARFLHDDKCELRFDNDIKLETTNTGVTVTGTVAATAFTGDGSNLTGLASREFYGFTGIGNSLSLTTTNSGADNIDGATYAAFEESFTGPSGISFSINASGNLIMTV